MRRGLLEVLQVERSGKLRKVQHQRCLRHLEHGVSCNKIRRKGAKQNNATYHHAERRTSLGSDTRLQFEAFRQE